MCLGDRFVIGYFILHILVFIFILEIVCSFKKSIVKLLKNWKKMKLIIFVNILKTVLRMNNINIIQLMKHDIHNPTIFHLAKYQ